MTYTFSPIISFYEERAKPTAICFILSAPWALNTRLDDSSFHERCAISHGEGSEWRDHVDPMSGLEQEDLNISWSYLD